MVYYDIWILDSSGLCVFHKPFDHRKFDTDLITGFFSALIQFTKEVVNEHLDILDMTKKRFVIHRAKNLILVALVDSSAAISSVRENLIKLRDVFLKNFGENWYETWDGNIKLFHEIGPAIDEIFEKKEIFGEIESREEFQKLLHSLNEMNEVKGSALLTETGSPIISYLNAEVLLSVVKHIEVHHEARAHSIKKMIYEMESETIVLVGFWKLVLAILFRKGTPLGMAELIIEECSKKIEKISYYLK
ncbi:MAG: hypothetical protein ACTSRW_06045 [Candidatus Helarchaeota archaeon]